MITLKRGTLIRAGVKRLATQPRQIHLPSEGAFCELQEPLRARRIPAAV